MHATGSQAPEPASRRRAATRRRSASPPNAAWRAPAPKRPCARSCKSTPTFALNRHTSRGVRDFSGSCRSVRPGQAPTGAGASAPTKQPLEEAARCGGFAARRRGGALLSALLGFQAGADQLVHLVRDVKVTLAELAIDVVARIGVPDEAHDLDEELAVSPQRGIARLEQREGGAAHARVLRAEHTIDVRSLQCAVLDHDRFPRGESL